MALDVATVLREEDNIARRQRKALQATFFMLAMGQGAQLASSRVYLGDAGAVTERKLRHSSEENKNKYQKGKRKAHGAQETDNPAAPRR